MFRSQPQPKPLAIALLAAMASMIAMPAAAQDAGEQQQEAKTLDALVVTAQKREEAMQDVPIVVTALSQQMLQDTGVRDIKDMQILVPGLTVTSTQNEAITTARIRGIGTVGDNMGLESSVGVVIDGVYRPRNSVGFGDLGELERIEVLKGPQGTLFGKNTSAGVINVVTRNPDFEPGAGAEITVGNYSAKGLSGWFNVPMGDVAAFRLYAAHRNRDGWMDVETGAGPRKVDNDYDQDFSTVRAKMLLQPTENVEIVLAADWTSRDENCCTAVQLVSGGTAPIINALGGGNAIAIPADPWARVSYSNRSTGQMIDDHGMQAEVNIDLNAFGGATFTSITAGRDWGAVNGRDFDFSTADLIYMNPQEDESFNGFKTFSQEFRLAGSTDSVDWLVGFFYTNEDLEKTETYRVGAAYEPYLSTLVGSNALPPLAAALNPTLAALSQMYNLPFTLAVNTANPALLLSQFSGLPYGTNFSGLGALDKYEQNAKSVALFTNNTWHATDALDVTLGLRYTSEKKTLDATYSNPNGGLGCAAALQDPVAGVARMLAARIDNFNLLPQPVQQQLLAQLTPAVAASPGLVSGIVGRMCLPWTNVLHDGAMTHQSRTEKEWSGTLKFAYRWNEHAMTYFSAARGYKAGGFNLDRTQEGITPTTNDTSFPGEFVDSYELGAKTTWAGGNLLLNATLFHQTYTDFQLNSFLGTSFVVRSIPEVVSRGLDAEMLWQAKPGLMLQTGLMYASTKYASHIPGADFTYPGQLYKLPGAQMSFAPKLSLSASVTYEWDIGSNLEGRFNIGGKYQSEYNTGSDLDDEKLQDGYGLVNARIGIGSRDRKWQLELWGQNIFDQDYVQVAFDGPLQAVGTPSPGDPLNTYNAFLGAPAMYGLTLRFQF